MDPWAAALQQQAGSPRSPSGAITPASAGPALHVPPPLALLPPQQQQQQQQQAQYVLVSLDPNGALGQGALATQPGYAFVHTAPSPAPQQKQPQQQQAFGSLDHASLHALGAALGIPSMHEGAHPGTSSCVAAVALPTHQQQQAAGGGAAALAALSQQMGALGMPERAAMRPQQGPGQGGTGGRQRGGGGGGGGAGEGGGGAPCSLYVKGLPPSADEQFLLQAFGPYGALHSWRVKRDPSTGQCSGVGFVNFHEQGSAVQAVQALNGAALSTGGRLHVQLQAPRAQRAANAANYRAALYDGVPSTGPRPPQPFSHRAASPAYPGPLASLDPATAHLQAAFAPAVPQAFFVPHASSATATAAQAVRQQQAALFPAGVPFRPMNAAGLAAPQAAPPLQYHLAAPGALQALAGGYGGAALVAAPGASHAGGGAAAAAPHPGHP